MNLQGKLGKTLISFFFFFPYLQHVEVAQARDQTHHTGVSQATSVTRPDP